MTDADLLRNHTKLMRIIDIAIFRHDAKHNRVKDRISRRSAYLKYGEHNVKYWERACNLKTTKGTGKNSAIWYSVTELDCLALNTL